MAGGLPEKPIPTMLQPGERVFLTPAGQRAAAERGRREAREAETRRRRALPVTQQTAGDRPGLFAALLLWPLLIAIAARLTS